MFVRDLMIQFCSEWSDTCTLLCVQIEIDLGPECRFHSMFACPILRQQSTGNNPPVRLVCGHVISRDALQKLTSGSKWAPLLPHIDHTATLQQKYVHSSHSAVALEWFIFLHLVGCWWWGCINEFFPLLTVFNPCCQQAELVASRERRHV